MVPSEHRQVLKVIHDGLRDSDVTCAITGSLGFAVHGIDVSVNDIDLQTNCDGAYQIEKAFRANVIRAVGPLETETIRSHFGELNILGVPIEIMEAVQKKLSDGAWESPVDIKKYRTWVEFEGMKLPVLSLEYEERAYRTLGRIDKADRIRAWLTRRGGGGAARR